MITLLVLPAYLQKSKTMKTTIQVAIIEDLKDVAYSLKELFNTTEVLVCNQVYHDAESAITFLS